MKYLLISGLLCVLLILPVHSQSTVSALDPVKEIQSKLLLLPEAEPEVATVDWLIESPGQTARVSRKGESNLIISNGLISRTFRLFPNVVTHSIRNLVTSEEFLRSVRPESELVIDGVTYNVGGLKGQLEQGYLLTEWLEDMQTVDNAFVLSDFEVKELTDHIEWKQSRWIPATQWEREGLEIVFHYTYPGKQLMGVELEVHYEIYNAIPLISKWIVLKNDGSSDIQLDHFTSEIIAHPEKNNYVDEPHQWDPPNLYMENDYAFSGFTYAESDRSVFWETDSGYTSQVNWELKTPAVLKSQPRTGPEYRISPGDQFESFRTYTLALDGTDLERNGLSKRKMYRTLAPWVTENPIFLHLTTTKPAKVKEAIDQCAETGYEMVILSFGSGLNMEDLSEKNIEKFRMLVDYAHGKGIELGGYSLFSSRSINDQTDVIDLETGRPGGAKFGHAPCGGSEWGINYFASLKSFIEQTGFDILEHDGPYPGDFCASTTHPGHDGFGDSQWKQWRQTTDFYKWLRSKGVYANMPDFYLLSGTSKVGIGYREVNWSLPRAQQIMLGRQNIYDGTWLRTPSMGWTFVPLTQYHGGGKAATLEPLSEHLEEYQAHMIQNYGSGVQACYRGPRLYDTEDTRELVTQTISFYKKYREILNADIIHLRRPDGRDWDGILHADPSLKTKGFAMLYNPTDKPISRKLALPLYYCGLSETAQVSVDEGEFSSYTLNRDYEIELEVSIPAHGSRRVVIK
ncbi:MAG: hypothetical protein KAR16_05860 [Bacteroidales bacterium]|nr:hypothetical protein [Bacteroidales bacterium]